jgi:uncharacterized protein DUF1353
MPFGPDSTVEVREIEDDGQEGRNWSLLHELHYQGTRQRFLVPVGVSTDFASIPRVFVWFLPQYGRYTKAAILHDYLWSRGVPARELTRAEADAIFRRALRELGVPFLRRWIMWAGVRIGALKERDGRKGWLKDSWLVFPLLLLALPILGPPALVITIALLVFYVVEFVVYLPLKFGAQAAAPRALRPPKEVNKPKLGWKLA